VDTQVDPAIIGGFVARIGDKLLDGSTRARLEALKKRLVESA
jgi:F0F1-type ATP synthase delta subunit